MNPSAFTAARAGELLRITLNGELDHAFIPFPLPPGWEFPTALWPILAEAKEAVARLDGIGRALPNQSTLILTPLRRREALTSSALEGTHATPEQLVLLEMGGPQAEADSGTRNEWREVSNYHKALNEGIRLLGEMPFCLRLFKTLHATLLEGVPARYKAPGEFRSHQVAIGSDRRYIPPPAERLADCLNSLEQFINSDTPSMDPLVKAFVVHYQFEAIHPFYDGNGRIGRLLLSLMIAKWRNEPAAWLYMSAYFERFKEEYISRMYDVSARGGWTPWIEFCLRGVVRQANDSLRRCEELKRLQADFERRLGSTGSKRTASIVRGLFVDPILFVGMLCRDYKITPPTARAEIARLMALGILSQLPDIWPPAYCASEVFAIAYATQSSDLI